MCVFHREKIEKKLSLLINVLLIASLAFLSSFRLFSLSYWKNVLQLGGKNDDEVNVEHTFSSFLDFLYKTEGKIQVIISKV